MIPHNTNPANDSDTDTDALSDADFCDFVCVDRKLETAAQAAAEWGLRREAPIKELEVGELSVCLLIE